MKLWKRSSKFFYAISSCFQRSWQNLFLKNYFYAEQAPIKGEETEQEGKTGHKTIIYQNVVGSHYRLQRTDVHSS